MNKSKTSLFLLELSIALLFLSICSAVCMKIFAHAGVIIKNTQVLNQAVSVSQTAAEYYKASNADLVLTAEKLGARVKGTTNPMVFYPYDAVYNQETGEYDGYVLQILPVETDGRVKSAIITVIGPSGVIYELTASVLTEGWDAS